MKKSLLTAVSVAALLAFGSASYAAGNVEHHAQDGDDTATITQTGNNNTIGVDNANLTLEVQQRSGVNTLTIEQVGDGNQMTRALTSQNATSNDPSHSFQGGGDNTASIRQLGTDNRIRRFVQNGDGNALTYTQQGDRNGRIGDLVNNVSNNPNLGDVMVTAFPEVDDFGGSFAFGADGPVATRASQMIQAGDNNAIELNSGMASGDVQNGASVAQLGSDNVVGGDGGGAFNQDGSRNLLLAFQESNFNTLGGSQVGNDNLMATDQQGGGNTITATQDGDLNTFFGKQEAADNTITAAQLGNTNYATVTQSSTGNLSTFTQSGNNNSTNVTQN